VAVKAAISYKDTKHIFKELWQLKQEIALLYGKHESIARKQNSCSLIQSYTWLSEWTACEKLPLGKLDTLYLSLRHSESLQRSCCRSKCSGILRYVLWQTVLDVSNDRNAVIFNCKECFTLKVKELRSFSTAQQTHCSICTGRAVTIFFRTSQTVQYTAYHGVH